MRAHTTALFLAGLTFGLAGAVSAQAESGSTPPPAGQLEQREQRNARPGPAAPAGHRQPQAHRRDGLEERRGINPEFRRLEAGLGEEAYRPGPADEFPRHMREEEQAAQDTDQIRAVGQIEILSLDQHGATLIRAFGRS